jgi:hypothetical protein
VNYTELSQAIIDFTENTDPTFESNIPIFIQDTERRIYSSVLIPVLRKNVTGTTTAGVKYLTCPTDFLAPYELAVVNPTDGTYSYALQKDVSFVRQNYPDPAYTGVPQYYAQFDVDSFILAPTPAQDYAVELHYYYYPLTIVKGVIAGFAAPVGGSGYVNGTYENVILTGGNGQGAVATITVSGNAVVAVTLISGGYLYLNGDILSCPNTFLGGAGSGFSVTVNNIVNPKGTSWLGDNFPMCLLYGALCEANIFMKGESDIQQNYEKLFGDNMGLLKNYADGRTRNDNFRTQLPRGKFQ